MQLAHADDDQEKSHADTPAPPLLLPELEPLCSQ
jgi:hypothetical protein